jgi:hypothetical protein
MALLPEQILDLVASVQTNYPFKGWNSVAQEQQNYIAFTQFFKKRKTVEDGGTELGFTIQYDYQKTGGYVGLYNTVTASVRNTMTQGSMPWRFWYDNYSYDKKEKAFNSGDKIKIFDLIKTRRESAWLGAAESIEQNFWGDPAAVDTAVDPMPLKYWLTLANGGTGAFDGNYHTSFTTKGAIAMATATRYRNWSNTYTNITEADLWFKIKEAIDKCQFKCPVPNSAASNPMPKRTICVSYDTRNSLQELAEARNESLGKDGWYLDAPTWKGVPMVWVPNLDDDNPNTPQTYDAVVGIDWSTFAINFAKGMQLQENKPIIPSNQPSVVRTDMESSYNTCAKNLRGNFVIADNYLWSPSA